MFSRSLEGFGLVVKSLSSMAANLESIPSAAACAACQKPTNQHFVFTWKKTGKKTAGRWNFKLILGATCLGRLQGVVFFFGANRSTT